MVFEFKNEYYCITYDVRGLGNSQFGSLQFTMESYVEDLEMIISELNLNEPILCGFSMGGYIALRANERANYRALILANTTTNSDDNEGKLKRAAAISTIDKKGLSFFLDNFLSVAFSEDFIKNQSTTIEKIKNNILKFNSDGIKSALIAMVSRTDTTKGLENTDIPVLFIDAEDDKIIKNMKELASKTKKSTYVKIPNSGHMSMIENPMEFKSAIRNFLESNLYM
ncbi:alpha/beta fold hydrolase [Sulfurospirillum sp. 1307]